MQCDAARAGALAARDFFSENRLTVLLVYISIINVVTARLGSWVKKLPMYAFLDPDNKFATPTRLMQSLLSPLFFLGYAVLIINAATGCNVSEPFIYYIAVWAPFFDLHELIKRWPLRPSLAVHHYATLGLCLAIAEYRVLPSSVDRDAPFNPLFIAFFGGLGFQWSTDIFSSVFRLSSSLSKIRLSRKCYLLAALPRLANSGCLLALGVQAGVAHNWFGMCFSLVMGSSHAFEQQRALRWVYHFDVAKYFAMHQAKQLGPTLMQVAIEDVPTALNTDDVEVVTEPAPKPRVTLAETRNKTDSKGSALFRSTRSMGLIMETSKDGTPALAESSALSRL